MRETGHTRTLTAPAALAVNAAEVQARDLSDPGILSLLLLQMS